MLASYLAATQQLLQNPQAPNALYDPAVLTSNINTARVQVAGEGLCIRSLASVTLGLHVNGAYRFADLNTGVSATNGIQGVLNVRSLWYISGAGLVWIAPRSFDWYGIYGYNRVTPVFGPPIEWSQYSQGVNGSFYVNPDPDQTYVMNADCICYPIPLVDDTTVEAVPPLWQTAVPYFAAYMALLSAQTGARVQDAQKMLQLYELFMGRARRFANPDIMPLQYEQAIPDVRATQYAGTQPNPAGG